MWVFKCLDYESYNFDLEEIMEKINSKKINKFFVISILVIFVVGVLTFLV